MVVDKTLTDSAAIYLGDSCEILKEIPDNSIHYSIFSPPFASLYTYSNSERDLGNCRSTEGIVLQAGVLKPSGGRGRKVSSNAVLDERSRELVRCDAEIERCDAYLREGHHEQMELALMGLHDWMRERKLIEREIESK